jgi:cytochrome c oxidase assembly protein subunit 15
LVALQMVLGVADVLLLAPTWMQITHLFGADLLWISIVVLAARLCVVPIGCPGGGLVCPMSGKSLSR